MVDGIRREPILGVPVTGPLMKLTDTIRRLQLQLVAQEIAEEVVIAIPLARAVERNDKQVALLQRQQERVAIRTSGDGIAQRGRHAIKQGGLQQKVLDVGGLALDDILHEVIQDMAIAAGERFQQPRHIVTAAQGLGSNSRPAAQPSVRCCTAAISAAGSSVCATRCRNSRASSAVNCKSPWRISATLPWRARRRAEVAGRHASRSPDASGAADAPRGRRSAGAARAVTRW